MSSRISRHGGAGIAKCQHDDRPADKNGISSGEWQGKDKEAESESESRHISF